jgi:hypothetical protein|tara:strand:+ start:129 stop:257 length:129 start_codon:yes stop_codon:yes gene_type:complete
MKTFTKEMEKNGKKILKDPLSKAQVLMIKAAILSHNGKIKEA